MTLRIWLVVLVSPITYILLYSFLFWSLISRCYRNRVRQILQTPILYKVNNRSSSENFKQALTIGDGDLEIKNWAPKVPHHAGGGGGKDGDDRHQIVDEVKRKNRAWPRRLRVWLNPSTAAGVRRKNSSPQTTALPPSSSPTSPGRAGEGRARCQAPRGGRERPYMWPEPLRLRSARLRPTQTPPRPLGPNFSSQP